MSESAVASPRLNKTIRYEPDERCSPLVALGVGAQGITLVIAPTVLIVAITVLATGQGESYLTWSVFAALIIVGIIISLQAAKIGRLGGGHILITGVTPNFIAVSILALDEGGPSMLASLIVLSSLFYLGVVAWLPLLRRIITPVVSGSVLMLIAALILPICFDRLSEVPEGTSTVAGPIVAAVTLIVSTLLVLRGPGIWRPLSLLIGIVAGCVAAVPFGLYDLASLAEKSWVGIPEIEFPGTGRDANRRLLGAASDVPDRDSGTGYQEHRGRCGRAAGGEAETPRDRFSPDTRVNVCERDRHSAVGRCRDAAHDLLFVAHGLAHPPHRGRGPKRGVRHGGDPPRACYVSEGDGVLLIIPSPVMGGFLLVAVAMLFLEGIQTLSRAGLDPQKAIVAGLAFSIGLGMENHNVLEDLLGSPWGTLLGNGITIGAATAIALTAFLEFTGPRGKRLEVSLDISDLPKIDAFLQELAEKIGWDDTSTGKLRSAGEEALSSLLQPGNERPEGKPTRLIVTARPEGRSVELEFVTAFEDENLEDRLTYLDEQAEAEDEREISFRLLRHYASSVRHQKYQGMDIVTVRVDG